MKILITGHRGFIGKHLLQEIQSREEIILIDNVLDDIGKIPHIDAVVHLGGKSSIPYSIANPAETYKINVLGTINMLELCRRDDAKFIFPSSSHASPDAFSPYGLQKHQCEEAIRLYSELYYINYCILRLYNVFGPGERGVIGAFQRAAKEGKPLEIWGGSQRHDFVHIATVMQCIIDAIYETQGYIEVGSGRTISIQEIANMISPNQNIMQIKPGGLSVESRCTTPTDTMSVEEYVNATR